MQSACSILERFGQGLEDAVEMALFFTELDTLAGFCDFFQTNHSVNLANPLGFSLEYPNQRKKLLESYRRNFNKMLEVLGQTGYQ